MPIYRGPGGASETTDQATITAVQTAAAQAASSATAAASSATTASNNASAAASSASTASGHASTAAGYVTSAANQAAAAVLSAAEAEGFATDAEGSAEEAASSASAASGHATTANDHMNNAETYMDRAEAAAEAAAGSYADTAAVYDAFDDRYLGAKQEDPATDNDGNTLIAGALYFNTTVPEMRVWDAELEAWTNFAAGSSVASFNSRTGVVTLLSTDVTNALGYTPVDEDDIGITVQPYDASIVSDASYVHTDNNFTTTLKNKLDGIAAGAEVNVNADWNASSGDAQILNKPTLATVATSGSYTDLSNKPTLGTAAATNSTAYATAAQGTKADTAYGWGNHASAGYLTSFTETDPVYVASSWYSTTNNATNWNTAYGWGNHALAGYLTSSSTIDGGTY